MKHVTARFCLFASIFLSLIASGCTNRSENADSFKKYIIDSDGPRDPWAKSVGDIDGDGKTDLIVGGHQFKKPDLWKRILHRLHILNYTWPDQGELYWYKNPSWEKNLVSDKFRFRTDIEVVDINGDGKNDIVAVTDQGLIWFKNPEWTPQLIENRILHDLEVADFDGDGDFDIVARNQSLFGHNDGDKLHFYRQDSSSKWVHIDIKTVAGEGLKVADMDTDGRVDVVVNNHWYRNPGRLSTSTEWKVHPYCLSWIWPDVFLDVADMNQDGRPDVVLAPAEPAGKHYRISWCEAPATKGGNWIEHIIDPRIESVVHSIRAGDVNNDGLMDVVAADMVQGEDPDAVSVYWQAHSNVTWRKEVVAATGSHSMRLLDFDKDRDLDFFGANWEGNHQTVELWENQKKK